MNQKLYTIYDSKAETYANPFLQRTNGEAMRNFADVCNQDDTQYHKHPEDFTLLEIGEWNAITGDIQLNETKNSLGRAQEFIVQ